jgi:tetratricopeptide (TPR) repeat protein
MLDWFAYALKGGPFAAKQAKRWWNRDVGRNLNRRIIQAIEERKTWAPGLRDELISQWEAVRGDTEVTSITRKLLDEPTPSLKDRLRQRLGELLADLDLILGVDGTADALTNTVMGQLGAAQKTPGRRDQFEQLVTRLEVAEGFTRIEARLDVLAATAAEAPEPQVFQLPPEVVHFTDREDEIAALVHAFDAPPEPAPALCVVFGKPGVGKSALATRLAHRLAQRFPDAQLYADLRGGAVTASTVLGEFLTALGVKEFPAEERQRTALFRQAIRGRRVLLVLDNVHAEDQVRPLVPSSSTCGVIVASRSALAGLEGASARLNLDVLDPASSRALLERVVGDPERRGDVSALAPEIVELCGHLPLAVRIVGARLQARPGLSAADLTARLRDERRRLDELKAGDRAVRTAFALSYDDLPPRQAELFRLLGAVPGPTIPTTVAAALLRTSVDEADSLLGSLVDAQLVQTAAAGHYSLHDLLRLFASERLAAEDAGRLRKAKEQVIAVYIDGAGEATGVLDPSPDLSREQMAVLRSHAVAWFEAERENLVAVVELAHREGDWDATSMLAMELTAFLSLRGYLDDGQRTLELALDATRRSSSNGAAKEALVLDSLGRVLALRGKPEEGIVHLERSLELRREHGDTRGEVSATNNVALLYEKMGRSDEARALYERSITLARSIEDRQTEALSLNNLALLDAIDGELDVALRRLEESLAIKRDLGDFPGQAGALENIGRVRLRQGSNGEAIADLQRSIELYQDVRDDRGLAGARHLLGSALWDDEQFGAAIEQLDHAADGFRALDDPRGFAQSRMVSALVLEQQGRWEEAVRRQEETLDGFRAADDVEGHALTLGSLVRLHTDCGQDGVAPALESASRIDDPTDAARMLAGFADWLRTNDHLAEAATIYAEALKLRRTSGDPRGVATTLWNLGVVQELMGRRDLSVPTWREALATPGALNEQERQQIENMIGG